MWCRWLSDSDMLTSSGHLTFPSNTVTLVLKMTDFSVKANKHRLRSTGTQLYVGQTVHRVIQAGTVVEWCLVKVYMQSLVWQLLYFTCLEWLVFCMHRYACNVVQWIKITFYLLIHMLVKLIKDQLKECCSQGSHCNDIIKIQDFSSTFRDPLT